MIPFQAELRPNVVVPPPPRSSAETNALGTPKRTSLKTKTPSSELKVIPPARGLSLQPTAILNLLLEGLGCDGETEEDIAIRLKPKLIADYKAEQVNKLLLRYWPALTRKQRAGLKLTETEIALLASAKVSVDAEATQEAERFEASEAEELASLHAQKIIEARAALEAFEPKHLLAKLNERAARQERADIEEDEVDATRVERALVLWATHPVADDDSRFEPFVESYETIFSKMIHRALHAGDDSRFDDGVQLQDCAVDFAEKTWKRIESGRYTEMGKGYKWLDWQWRAYVSAHFRRVSPVFCKLSDDFTEAGTSLYMSQREDSTARLTLNTEGTSEVLSDSLAELRGRLHAEGSVAEVRSKLTPRYRALFDDHLYFLRTRNDYDPRNNTQVAKITGKPIRTAGSQMKRLAEECFVAAQTHRPTPCAAARVHSHKGTKHIATCDPHN